MDMGNDINREGWKFPYPVAGVLRAAQAKLAHHTARLEWWENKKSDVADKIRAEGIEIDESLADMVSNSYQRGPSVHVRDDLLRDLQECVQKTREHRTKVEHFDGWAQVLADQPNDRTLELTHNDWLHFFGRM